MVLFVVGLPKLHSLKNTTRFVATARRAGVFLYFFRKIFVFLVCCTCPLVLYMYFKLQAIWKIDAVHIPLLYGTLLCRTFWDKSTRYNKCCYASIRPVSARYVLRLQNQSMPGRIRREDALQVDKSTTPVLMCLKPPAYLMFICGNCRLSKSASLGASSLSHLSILLIHLL